MHTAFIVWVWCTIVLSLLALRNGLFGFIGMIGLCMILLPFFIAAGLVFSA